MKKQNKKETCGLCKRSIDKNKDRWVRIIDHDGAKIESVRSYHRKCYIDKLLFHKTQLENTFKKRVSEGIKPLMKQLSALTGGLNG